MSQQAAPKKTFSATVTMRVLSPCWLNGAQHQPGDMVEIPAIDAFEAQGHRAVLADPAQLADVNAAVQSQQTQQGQQFRGWPMQAGQSQGSGWMFKP